MARLLELVAAGDMNDWSYPVYLPARLSAVWRSGPDEQRHDIDGLVLIWWRQATSTWPSRCEPRDVLYTIGDCGHSVTPYLAAWPMEAGEPAARQLAAPGLQSARLLLAGKPVLAGGRWLAIRAVASQMLAQQLASIDDPDLAEQLGDAVEHRELCREVRASH